MAFTANPAVIITLQRTGGSWLAGCLSNHPDIFCTRGEPLAKRSLWTRAAPDDVARLDLILRQQYYKIAMHLWIPVCGLYAPGVQYA